MAEENPYDYGDYDERWTVGWKATKPRMDKTREKIDYLKYELDLIALASPGAWEKGSGVLGAPVASGNAIDLNALCGITSYFSNYGGAGVDYQSEGFFMDVFLNGALMTPGAGNDYRESNPAGTGATTINFNYNLDTGERISVVVRKL